jgi:amino acid adenylation domain-containing protein
MNEEASKNLTNLSPDEKRALLARLLREKAKAGQPPPNHEAGVSTDGNGTSSSPPTSPTGMLSAFNGKVSSPDGKTGEQQEWAALSHGQRALWFLYRLAPNSTAYNLLYSARVSSALDIPTLQRSLQALVRRYPILTATYSMQGNEPVQHFHPQQQIQAEVIDASSWSTAELDQRLSEEGNRPFDLEKGPILRIQLFQRSSQEAILALTVHHIALDFWSLDILMDELYLLYAAERAGTQAPLPPPGPPFTAYVHWQSEMLAEREGEQLWTYWQQKLTGELPMLSLPTDRPRPPVQTYHGSSHSFPLSDTLTRQLRALATSEKVTLYMIVLAAFKTLLYRYTHQDDILVGTPMLGRSRADLERIVGYLVNPTVLRTDLSGNPSFRELVSRVRQTVVGALDHQDFPFALLVERLQPRRDPSYSPLFQSLFIWDKPRSRNEQELALLERNGISTRLTQQLKLEPYIMGQQGAPFDITLTIFEVDGSLSADFRYNVDLFDASTIARMEQHFVSLLEGAVAQPDQPILNLPLLTETERHQILVDWNATRRDYPDHSCIHQLIEAQVEKTPDADAVTFEGTTLSYRELNLRANLLARELQKLGVGPDVMVGVCMERSVEMVVALLGILKAGGAYVPLDPAYPQERLAYMIADSQVPVLLTQSSIVEHLPPVDAQILSLDAGWGAESDEQVANPVSGVQPDHLMYMIYTSGSTGKPKGVMNNHRGLANRLHWMQQEYQLTPADRVMQKTPFSFDVSVWEFFWPLLTGACLVVARPGGHQDPAYLASLIVEQRVTTMHFVPSMLHAFLLEPKLELCTSLKRVICSGEALSVDVQQRFFAHLDAELHNLYGPTEAAIDVTYWACQRDSRDLVVPIGRPIANTQIYILDEAMQPVPVGVPGELYIGGVGVARGYHNRPELTAEKFIRDPFSQQEGARLFKTGDLVRYRADGAIEFLGRIDFQVKIRGFRIELGEIEAVLNQHPAVKEVVVTAREDTPGNKRLVAYLVPTQANSTRQEGDVTPVLLSPQETGLSIEELRNFLKDKLPFYMVPAVFLFLDAMPLLPNGKVNRKALPAPDMSRPDLEEVFVAPRTPTEEKLARIWSEVLGLDKIGIRDNYFDLGGASIQSLEIISKANEAGLTLALESLFEFQTIEELASAIDRGASTSAEPSAAIPDSENVPATDVPTQVAPVPVAMPAREPDNGNMVIESLGVYLPPKAVTTDELLQGCVKPIRFPLARLTGIKSRRMAGDTEFSIDLAKQAIADCLAKSKYNPEDVDLLICGNISRCNRPNVQISFEPSNAIQLQRYFGFTNALVFDIDNACTGLFTAVEIIDAFLKAGLIRRGMAVSGEYISHLSVTAQKELEGFMDSRLACLTVGDAGAALILERTPNKQVGFHDFELFTLGSYSRDCIGKATEREHGGGIMYTDAVRVSAVNMKYAVAHAAQIIARSGWPHDAFQHIIIHQTSSTTIRDAAREINSYFGKEVCTQDNVINNIAERGNTATTTQMVAIMDHVRSNRIQSGDNVMFGITGSGATIGSAIYTFDDLPDRIRRFEAGQYIPEKVRSELFVRPLLPATQRIRIESVGTVPLDGEVKKEVFELGRVAGENCLAASSYQRQDIDLVLYSGVYRDELLCEPAIASILEGDLKINDAIETPEEKKTFAFDVFNGTVGFLNACYTAITMIHARKANNALILAAEIENNRVIYPSELLGVEETGSALILDKSSDGVTGFGNFVFKYFTDYIEAFDAHSELRNGKMTMRYVQDPHLQDYYLQCVQATVGELLAIEGLELSQIKVVLPPQISSAFVDALSEAMQVSREKFVDVQSQYDLFTSSLPYALQYARDHQLVQPGDIALLISVGSGIQVGCATYHF